MTRLLLAWLLFLLVALSSHSQEPVRPEKATDWKVLYEGGDLRELAVSGPLKQEGKMLVLGGANQMAELGTTLPLGDRFDLFIEYRLRGTGTVQITTSGMLGSGSLGTGLPSSGEPDNWIQSIYRSGMDAQGEGVLMLRSRGQGKAPDAGEAPWQDYPMGQIGVRGSTSIRFRVLPGSTLEIRTLKVRGEMDDLAWLWYAGVGGLLAILLVFIVLLLILRRRRIRLPRTRHGERPDEQPAV